MKKLFLTLVIVLSLLRVHAQKDTTTIIFLHTNDMHGQIDYYPQIAYLIDSIRNIYANVFLFSAGDLVTGNPIVDRYDPKGYPMIDLMNNMHYNISAVGNHEFDMKQKGFNFAMKKAEFPFVCANINTSNSILNQPLPYFKLKTSNGISIGVLGFIQIERNGYPASSPINLEGITFSNALKEKTIIKKYKDSADIYICLSHLGVDTDQKLAKKYPYFDFIIGGHTHTILKKPIIINNTTIVQAGSYLRFLGMVTIKYYNGKIISVKDTLFAVDSTSKKDLRIKKIVDKYNSNTVYDKIVGNTKENINGKNELGAMITDAMLDTVKCDIAMQNNGGIRVHSLTAGNITLKDVYKLSPFGNVFYIYELNLDEIKKLIKYAYNLEKHNEIQIGGASMELYIDKNNNLKNIKLLDNKNKTLTNKKYKVAINDYMATSYQLKFLKNPIEKTTIIDADAITRYLEKYSPVDYKGVSRIKIIKE